MIEVNLIKIFVSCPSDILDEIPLIKSIIGEINKTSGKYDKFTLEFVNWQYDTYTGIGSDAQEVINTQINYDILVGILWLKTGTPTKRDKSGTIEEINVSFKQPDKKQLLYFKTKTPDNLNEINLDDLNLVNIFKSELKSKGVLYKEFNSEKEFESLFRINLTNIINDHFLINKKNKFPAINNFPAKENDKYKNIESVINQIESGNQVVEVDIFELTEKLTFSFGQMTSSLDSITQSLNFIRDCMKKRTEELNKIIHIKDLKLRTKKSQIVCDSMADEFHTFNIRIENEIPIFSENFSESTKAYSSFVLVTIDYDNEEIKSIKKSAVEYKVTMVGATNNCADFLRTVMGFTSLTPKFNKAKRETEITLKNLAKEMLNGLKLLDEVINDD